MPSVRVKDDVERAIRQFKRACEKAGILTEARHRERFEKPSEVRKRRKAAAVKRWHKKQQRETGGRRTTSRTATRTRTARSN